MDLHFFDPKTEYTVVERKLPHRLQAGVLCFATWRTDDSIPASVLEGWRQERRQWLRQHRINPISRDWRQQLQLLDIDAQTEFYQHFSKRWHDELDACHGACVLRDQSNAEIVSRSLPHFDGERYELTDFIVMPNHVHLLAALPLRPRCWHNANHGNISPLMKSIESSARAVDFGNRMDLITSCDQKNSFCISADTSPGMESRPGCRRQSICIIRSQCSHHAPP